MMCDGLGEPDLLAHAFAVARNPSAGCVTKLYALECLVGQPKRVAFAYAVKQQAVHQEFPPGQPARKRIELHAVSALATELRSVAWRQAAEGERSARCLNQTGH